MGKSRPDPPLLGAGLGGEVLEAMLARDAVHCIAPVRHLSSLVLQACLVGKGGRRGFSHLLLFSVPQGLCVHRVSHSATQPFLFKAVLKSRGTSWPLHSRRRRKAGKEGDRRASWESVCSKCLRASRRASAANKDLGDSAAMGTL